LVGDATVAFVGLLALLLIVDDSGKRLLTWEEAEKIPWGILLLFGGGIALASGFEESGLSKSMGAGLSILEGTPEPVLIFAICLGVTFLTEVTSNTATTALLMPILASAATSAGLSPEKLMVPAAISASCAFMLPVATAPNAIIFGSGDVPAPFMARTGLVLNLLGVLVITTVCVVLL
jgi:sodium-dependent dicarboxylate transporter 2/3/5